MATFRPKGILLGGDCFAFAAQERVKKLQVLLKALIKNVNTGGGAELSWPFRLNPTLPPADFTNKMLQNVMAVRLNRRGRLHYLRHRKAENPRCGAQESN